jgi:hypothetical protein
MTHNECSVLFLFGVGKHHHCVDNLDPRIRIEIDAFFFWPTVSWMPKKNKSANDQRQIDCGKKKKESASPKY